MYFDILSRNKSTKTFKNKNSNTLVLELYLEVGGAYAHTYSTA